MHTPVARLLIASAIVMGITQTITRERIFAPLRARLGGKETWLGYLFSCPYCLSHPVAFALVPLMGAYSADVVVPARFGGGVLRWFLSSILVTVIAAFMRVAFWFVDEGQALVRREKQLVEEA